jgi:mannose-6-phosphate isomerase-like protein (cupin superfamily)
MHIQPLDTAPLNERGGQKSWLLLTGGQFGAKNLAITLVQGAPGSMQAVHGHPDNEQIYVIVRGRGVMQVADEMQEVGEGTLVYIPPGAAHAIKNMSEEPLVFVSATSPPFNVLELNAYFGYKPSSAR